MEEFIIKTIDELENFNKSNPLNVVYFSTPECNVCKVLKPKVKELIGNDFPEVKFAYVDLNNAREIAGQLTIFTVPTIITFAEGSESIRESRNVNLSEFYDKLLRIYNFIYN